MSSRRPPSALLIAFCGLTGVLPAQQPGPPTLDMILQRLGENLDHYDASVPSLFCDEHVASEVDADKHYRETITDSTFRLRRTGGAGGTAGLVESREIKTVNGKPASAQDHEIGGPSTLHGVFEGGLAVVSPAQKACMKYRLERIDTRHPEAPYVIRFETALTPENADGCLLQEKSKGSVTIDPASMQIRRLDLETAHHTIIPGSAYEEAVVGKRALTIEYAPVLLAGQSLWMPSEIDMRSTSSGFGATVWLFRASYRNYHKLEVTSRIYAGPSDSRP